MAAATALATDQPRKENHASIEYAAHFDVQVATGNTEMKLCRKKTFRFSLCRPKGGQTKTTDVESGSKLDWKMLVWCRKCSGYTRAKFGRKLLHSCQPSVGEKNNMLKRIQSLEEGHVLGRQDWRIEGKKVRVTRTEFQGQKFVVVKHCKAIAEEHLEQVKK